MNVDARPPRPETAVADEAAASPLAPRRPGARLVVAILAAAASALALFLLWRVLHRYSIEEIAAAVGAIPAGRLAAAALAAAGSYLVLTFFDFAGVRYAGSRLSWRKVALASFTALSIGHSIGLAALSSGALRYRFYCWWGLGRGDVVRIILFCAATSALGLAAVNGAALVAAPGLLAEIVAAPPALLRAAGFAALAAIPAYAAAMIGLKPEFRFRGWRLSAPPPRLVLAQIVLGPANFLLVAATLHQLLSASTEVGFLAVAGIYGVANLIAILAHVPGGWGVLEMAVVLALPEIDPIGALVAFRAIYWLLPFLLGLVSLAAAELWRHRLRSRARAGSRATPWSG
jgi:uncharacterized membrane protein YbhN (UPF0104 family)